LSKPDWIAKLGIVLKMNLNKRYWIELLVESNLINREKGDAAIKEADEILSMVASSIKTSKLNPKG
jgi:four helix bundle protein